jgi:hypothetical protein
MAKEKRLSGTFERLPRRIQGLDATQAVVTPLVGGMTNQNYRADINGTRLLGINRGTKMAPCMATCQPIARRRARG